MTEDTPEPTTVGGLDLAELDLPMLPNVAVEVLQLCQQEDSDAAALSAVLHRDPSLASNVIRTANSAIQGASVAITSLQQAVSRLGLRQVADLAIAVSVRGLLFKEGDELDRLQRLWRHSVATGFFAREIARVRRSNVQSTFLCGLLHDIGKAVLLVNLERLLTGLGTGFLPELEEFLEDYHGPAGAFLARTWKLPEAIRASAQFHHDPDAAGEHVLEVHTVRLADRIAAMLTDGEEPAEEGEIRACPSLEKLDLYGDDLDTILGMSDRCLAIVEEMS